jgi:hypothetical protein
MRTLVFPNINASLDGQQSPSASPHHEWSSFDHELPYDMMFNDPNHDPAEEFGNEDKPDEAQTYGYLHEDLEPTTIEHDTRNDGPAEIPAVTTAEQVEEVRVK